MGEYAEAAIEQEVENFIKFGNPWGPTRRPTKRRKRKDLNTSKIRKDRFKRNKEILDRSNLVEYKECDHSFLYVGKDGVKYHFHLCLNKWCFGPGTVAGVGDANDFLKWIEVNHD